jgi:hypothetical protein
MQGFLQLFTVPASDCEESQTSLAAPWLQPLTNGFLLRLAVRNYNCLGAHNSTCKVFLHRTTVTILAATRAINRVADLILPLRGLARFELVVAIQNQQPYLAACQ